MYTATTLAHTLKRNVNEYVLKVIAWLWCFAVISYISQSFIFLEFHKLVVVHGAVSHYITIALPVLIGIALLLPKHSSKHQGQTKSSQSEPKSNDELSVPEKVKV